MSVPSKQQEESGSTFGQQHSIMTPEPPPPYQPTGPAVGHPVGHPVGYPVGSPAAVPPGAFVGTARYTTVSRDSAAENGGHPATYYTTTTVHTTRFTRFRDMHPFQKGVFIFIAVFFLLVLVGVITGIAMAIKSSIKFDEEWKKNGSW